MSEVTFPSIVYRSPGPHAGPPREDPDTGKLISTTYESKGVNSEAELAKASKHGWFITLLEAVDPNARDFIAEARVRAEDDAVESALALLRKKGLIEAAPAIPEDPKHVEWKDADKASLALEAESMGLKVDKRKSAKDIADLIAEEKAKKAKGG